MEVTMSDASVTCMGCRALNHSDKTQSFTLRFTNVNGPVQEIGPFVLCRDCSMMYLEMINQIDAARNNFLRQLSEYFMSNGEEESGFKRFFQKQEGQLDMVIQYDTGSTRH
jgi:hypothetical protein